MTKPVLTVNHFNCHVGDADAPIHISKDICLQLNAGEVMAIVGESGSGKSLTFSRIFGVGHYSHQSGEVILQRDVIGGLSTQALAELRGQKVGFLFQDPATAFNPTLSLGKQLCEAPVNHGLMNKADAKAKALNLLAECDLENPGELFDSYPHQLSGGMLQRVMLAMALMCDPVLLVADEPTTALDAISADKILGLIKSFTQRLDMACILITHDFDVVAQAASHIGVMYAGELIETGTLAAVMTQPQHPYTKALQNCRPIKGHRPEILTVIEGRPPVFSDQPSGCSFHPRCSEAMVICAQQAPPLEDSCKCWLNHKNQDEADAKV